MATLVGLLGASDNLDETQPVLNRQDAIIGLSLSFLVLTWLCVLFRFYARFFIMKSPWWDDLFVLLSVVSPRPGSMLRSPLPLCVIARWTCQQRDPPRLTQGTKHTDIRDYRV